MLDSKMLHFAHWTVSTQTQALRTKTNIAVSSSQCTCWALSLLGSDKTKTTTKANPHLSWPSVSQSPCLFSEIICWTQTGSTPSSDTAYSTCVRCCCLQPLCCLHKFSHSWAKLAQWAFTECETASSHKQWWAISGSSKLWFTDLPDAL